MRSALILILIYIISSFSGHMAFAQIDSVAQEPILEIDSNKVATDSLNKLIPYLDRVEADSQNELNVLYILAIAVSSLLSEDFAAIGAGLMAANDYLPFWYATFGAILGIFFGDFSLYFLGKYLGKPILKVAPFRWILNEDSIDNSSLWFDKKGPFILVLSRFIPGSRLPVYLTAGILGTGFWKFSLYFGLTALIWTPIFVWLSMIAGLEIFRMYEAYDQFAIPAILLLIALLAGFYKILPLLLTTAGRRFLWIRVKKLFRSAGK